MALYRYYDLIIDSNISLLEVESVSGGTPSCVFELLPARPRRRAPGSYREPWPSVGSCGSDTLLCFSQLADFFVSSDGKDIRCTPHDGTSLETLRHLLLNQVLPRVLHGREGAILHGSAVVSSRGAVGFLGKAGWGKSTIAASLCKSPFPLLPLLCDDAIVLRESEGRLVAVPSRSELRLWSDALEALFPRQPTADQMPHEMRKRRLVSDQEAVGVWKDTVPLERTYVLGPPEGSEAVGDTAIDSLSPTEAFVELIQNVFRLGIPNREKLEVEFHLLTRVAEVVPVFRLQFPRRLSALPRTREAILEHLEA